MGPGIRHKSVNGYRRKHCLRLPSVQPVQSRAREMQHITRDVSQLPALDRAQAIHVNSLLSTKLGIVRGQAGLLWFITTMIWLRPKLPTVGWT